MPLILAIDPDKRQSSQLASLVKAQLQAELVQRGTAAEALAALDGRVPDLVLTTSLISPREDAVLATYLRELGSAAAHVQTVTIPLLGSAAPKRAKGVLAALRREKPQPAMTDGCAPDVFAEQIRQYLATAEEQKAAEPVAAFVEPPAFETEPEADVFVEPSVAADAAWPEPEMDLGAAAEPVLAATEFEPIVDIAPVVDAAPPVEVAPIVEAAPVIEAAPILEAPAVEPLSHDAWEAAAAEPVLADAVFETPPVDAEPEIDPLVADEPGGVPLSQLLQMVSEWQAPVAAAPAPAGETLEEPSVSFEPVVDAPAAVDTAAEEALEAGPAHANDFGELYVDPAAAQALDELSRETPAPSMHDGIPAEAPVPVVEMRSFDSLDSIASQFAVGPAPKYDDLDDIASLLAAPAARGAAQPEAFFAAPTSQTQDFESLFAAPAATPESHEPIEVPGIDPSLFAAAPSRQAESEAPVDRPFEGFSYTRDEIFARPVASAPEASPTLEDTAAPFESLTMEPAAAVAEVSEPAIVAPEPEPVLVASEPEPEPVAFIVPEPVLAAPVIAEPVPSDPVSLEAVIQEPVVAAPAPVELSWPEPEPEPLAAAPVEAVYDEAVVDEPLQVEPMTFEPVAFAPVCVEPAATPLADTIGEEISLDVDAFTAMPEAPAEASRFSFTFVDSFGDAWSDFEVPTTDALAADLGVAAHAPQDPYETTSAPMAAQETTAASQASPMGEPAAAPVLDDEALSMIGDAARKVSLDALVIEEFERGVRRTPRKPKKKAHAGATPVAPAPERPAAKKKGPVQDEWGLFDPEQCGFAALEDEDADPRKTRDGNTRVRVITY
jgi:hypothetical protein